MAYPKKLNASNKENQDIAINAHKGFLHLVTSRVEQFGVENVLAFKPNSKDYWLKQAYERVLDFAEDVQVKLIPQQLHGSGDDGEFIVKVEIADYENNPAQESGSRIQEYFQV